MQWKLFENQLRTDPSALKTKSVLTFSIVCLAVNNIIIIVPHTACRYEKSSWSECSADGEMSRVDKLKANSDPACDQSRRITKKCNKNKQVKATKDKGANDLYFFNFSKLLENTYPFNLFISGHRNRQ